MFKYTIALLAVILTSTSFALEYKVTSEQKYLNTDGTSKFNGTSAYLVYSFKSKDQNFFETVMDQKILAQNGNVLTEVSHKGSDFSVEQVRSLTSIYANCPSLEGKYEALTIKAGPFKACKLNRGILTEWFIAGFPFSIKRIVQDTTGKSVVEAIKVEIIK